MTDHDEDLIEMVAENAFEVDVSRARKPELLMAVFEMLEIPYDPDKVSGNGVVRATDLRAIIYGICLSDYIEYTHPDDQEETEKLMLGNAPVVRDD